VRWVREPLEKSQAAMERKCSNEPAQNAVVRRRMPCQARSFAAKSGMHGMQQQAPTRSSLKGLV